MSKFGQFQMYPDLNMNNQQKLLLAAVEMWQTKGIELDMINASARFEIPPRQANAIISYALANLKNQNFKYGEAFSKQLTNNELFSFIRAVQLNPDLWILPPIIRKGFRSVHWFLFCFGGRHYYADQLILPNCSFSLNGLVVQILENCFSEWQKLLSLSYKMRRSFYVPQWEDFAKCLGGQREMTYYLKKLVSSKSGEKH